MLDQVEFDQEKLENGAWVKLHNSKFLIAHASKQKFKAVVSSIISKSGPISDIELCNAIATHILLDWDDVMTPWGGKLEYSKDLAAYALATNEELREFVDKVSVDYSYFK